MDKKVFCLFFICFIGLFVISSVNAVEDKITSDYQVTSDLSNEDIQKVFDSANDGDTIEFKSKEYKNISLVVDKKLNIISKVNSNIHVSFDIKNLRINKTFGFAVDRKSVV